MASRNLGTTAWTFTGPMPGMPSASARDFGLLERKKWETQWRVGSQALTGETIFIKTPCNKMTELFSVNIIKFI